VLRVHGPAHGPDGSFPPFDPDHDAFLGSAVVDTRDPALSESTRRRSSPHP
jgi:hypothetical protein